MPSCQTRSSASSGHGPTLRGWQRALLALPASRSTGLQSLRRHDRLASSACTRFKVALSMTAYSTGHSLVHDDDQICAYSMLSKVNKVRKFRPFPGAPQRPRPKRGSTLSVVQCDEGHEDATGHKADTARIGAGRAAARGPQQARDQAASALGACRRSCVPLPAAPRAQVHGQDPRRRGHPHRTCGRTRCGTTAEPRSWTADEIAGAVCGGVKR